MTASSILVVDVGGTHLKVLAVEGDESRELGRHVPTASIRTADPVGSLADLIREASVELGLRPEAVVATVPGFLAPDRDLVSFAGNVPELNGRRLATELSDRLGLPVFLERDAVMQLRGEWEAGAGRGARSLLGLFFGTGVGGAFLQDSIPFRGAGNALEIGLMPFRAEGRTLEGLRTDCLEAYVSGRVLQGLAARHAVPIGEVFVAAAGIPALAADLDGFLADQAIAIGIAVALFSPDRVVLGGGVCEMRGFPRDDLARRLAVHGPFSEAGRPMDLRWAELGWRAVLHGARARASEGMALPGKGAERRPPDGRASGNGKHPAGAAGVSPPGG